MNKLRCGLIEGMTEFRLLMKKGKTLLLLSILAVMLMGYFYYVALLERHFGGGIGLLEPFIMMINTDLNQNHSPYIYFYLVFVTILSDIPSFTKGFRYRMVRMDKTSWWIGQITMILLFTLFYIVFVLFVSFIPTIGRWACIDRWSVCMEEIAWVRGINYPQEFFGTLWFHVPAGFIKEHSVLTAFGLSLGYSFAYLFVSGMIISLLHTAVQRLRPMAVPILMVWYMLYSMDAGLPGGYWVMPTALSRPALMNYALDAWISYPSYQYAAIWWITWSVVLAAGLFAAAKNLHLDGYLNKEE